MHAHRHTHALMHAHTHTQTRTSMHAHTHTPAYKHFICFWYSSLHTRSSKALKETLFRLILPPHPHCGKNSLSALVVTPKVVSNWIWMFCQPHRVTSGQSNSNISKCTFQNSSHKNTLSAVNPQDQSLHKQKNEAYIHKYQTQIFKELIPSVLPLLKEHIRPGHAGIVDHSVYFIHTRLKKNTKKRNGLNNDN